MISKKHPVFRAGTSNIVIPGTKKTFPAAFQSATRLTYYASLFNTLEVNSSFYKVPMPATFEKWSAEVSDNFQFSVKLWREITHAKALAYKLSDIDMFMTAANRVEDSKKGCLLIQFPASITISFIEKVAAILERIHTISPQHRWHICVEFRHTSWYTATTYHMLDSYKTSLVLHDMPASALYELHTKSAAVYLRFHGVKGDYKGSYEPEALQQYAGKINEWLQRKKTVYAYFNNTIGNAFYDAQMLHRLVTHK